MYQVLLLHKDLQGVCRVKDYLRLSGYEVMEGDLEQIGKYRDYVRGCNTILLYCENPEAYFEACERIRRMTSVPILVLSQCDDEWSKIRMFQAGADDYILEPFSQGEFIARVHAHILRYFRLSRPVSFVHVRELEIDGATRCVKVDGSEVLLRAKEFDLLWYLVQRVGKTITKQELYEAIWGDELGDSYFNSVAVHIKRIRRKIEKDPDNPQFLETVWGVGYRFVG